MSANRLEGTAARSFKIWLEMDQGFVPSQAFSRRYYPRHSELAYSRYGFGQNFDPENWYTVYLNEPEHFLASPEGLGISQSFNGIRIGEDSWKMGKNHPMRKIKGTIVFIAEDPYGAYSRFSRALGHGRKTILSYTPNEAVYGTKGVETIYDRQVRELTKNVRSGSPTLMEESTSVQKQDYDPMASSSYYEPLSSSITSVAKPDPNLEVGSTDYYYPTSNDPMDTSNREFFIDVFVTGLSKSEIDQKLGILSCTVEFDCVSPWYRIFGLGDTQPSGRTHDETIRMLQDYGYTKRIMCYGSSDYIHPCKMVIAPSSYVERPYWTWSAAVDNHTFQGEVSSAVPLNYGDGILIDTTKHPGEMWKVHTNNGWATYETTEWIIGQSDFTTTRYITLRNGVNRFSCTDRDHPEIEFSIPVLEVKEYYESV